MSTRTQVQTTKTGDFLRDETDVVILSTPDNPDFQNSYLGRADSGLSGRLRARMELGDFTGELKSTSWFYTEPNGAITAPRLLLAGLGPSDELTVEKTRQVYGHAAQEARDMGLKTATIPIPADVSEEMIQAIVEASLLSLYRFTPHKTVLEADEKKQLESLTFVAESEASLPSVARAVQHGQAIAEGTILARDLSNQPANHLTPTKLAEQAETVARETGLRCKVFDKAALEEKGFRTLLAVAQGSVEEPRFIILDYIPAIPKGEEQNPLVFIGKGITYDTGGISIKSAKGGLLEEMKHDMAGGATVIGAMQAIARLKPHIRVIGLIPATENMLSGSAIKPGDVITSYGGKTIEILDTDAEGRLVLADALGWAARYKPKGVIDLATLTGAVVQALGHVAAGVMGTDSALIDRVKTAGEKTHERVWELPLWDDYDGALKSKTADIQNVETDRAAGTIVAGTFLKKFAEKLPWVHLDIAGVVWEMQGSTYIPEKIASGWGVRLLCQLARDW